MTFAQHKTNGKQFAVYADCLPLRSAVSCPKHMVTASDSLKAPAIKMTEDMGVPSFQQLDFGSWLPFCAREYHISPNASDYVFVPVVAMPSDLPNRNGVGFPLKELVTWRTEDGMLAYQTFKGKPVHIEHDNQDPTKAVGVIVDTAMHQLKGFGEDRIWKLVLLLAIDRTKNPVYAKYVIDGEINSYSMGAWVEAYSCGYCNQPLGACKHIDKRRPRDFYELDGKLVYRKVHGIKGFECSIVRDPAYVSAISDNVMML